MTTSLKNFGSSYLIVIGILLGTAGLNPLFASTQLRSGPAQVTLMELYTSQGCNSCPPADQWVSELSNRSGLWVDYVPLAFHVDYWDYIGWKDRFAQPDFGGRQSRYQKEGGIYTVYTPGIIVNGKEWREWRSNGEPKKSGIHIGLLTANIGSGTANIHFSAAQKVDDNLVATVALLGFGLESEVNAGENRGRTLRNDFVVLGIEHIAMLSKERSFVATVDLPSTNIHADRYAVVVWISPRNQQSPLQAAGGWYNP